MTLFKTPLFHLSLISALLCSATAFSGDTLKQDAAQVISTLASNDDSLGSALNYGANRLADEASETIAERIQKYVPTAEIDISVSSDNKPEVGALILAPIWESKENDKLLFTQGSVYHLDGRTTGNIGIGARKLSYDDTVLFGVNSFYDYEFPYNHQRFSMGAEIRTTVAELNANYYYAITGWKDGRDGLDERALDGYDIELGVPLPYLPRTKAYVKRFRWESQSNQRLEHGFTYTLDSEIYDGVTIEVGHKNYNNSPDENIASVRVNLLDIFTKNEKKPFISKAAYSLDSMKDARYDKVRRENLIRKEFRNTNPLSMNVTGF